jgi:hypothetical protein
MIKTIIFWYLVSSAIAASLYILIMVNRGKR